jgi:uncharacterized protein (DUF2267 family)
MKCNEVFTPGVFPKVTFVDSHIKSKQQILRDGLETKSMLIAVSGPSKSGKTVFVEDVVGRDNLIHVTGAGVTNPDVLWQRVFDIIGTPTEQTKIKEKNTQAALSGKLTTEANAIFVKGGGEVGATGSWTEKNGVTEKHSQDFLQLLIKELKGTSYVIFIDDFHYIPKDVQKVLAEHIKEAIRQGINIVCASVPYHSDDVLKANSDLRGRILSIDLDYWTPEILAEIAVKGFAALNVKYSEPFLQSIIAESAGSPQLMQTICLNACYEGNVRTINADNSLTLGSNSDFTKSVCMRTVMSTDYSSVVEKMKEGPKTRGTERNQHVLKDGSRFDVYPIVLKAIAQNPPALNFRYTSLVDRIESLCGENGPSGSSVTGACLHISQIANDYANQNVLEWDGSSDVLDIRDPYLLFYLRWSEK